MSQTTDYQANFMNRILINPLAEIIEAVNNGQTLTSLHKMRNYINSLPNSVKEDLKIYVNQINDFIIDFHGIRGRNYSHTAANRQTFLDNKGVELSNHIYNLLFEMLYDKGLFDFVKFGKFFDPAGGKKSDTTNRVIT